MAMRRLSLAAEDTEFTSGEYRSLLFERFVAAVARIGPDAAILDLGPTTPSNITFWAHRGHRVSAIDLAARLERGGEFDLSGIKYGGIVCWNMLTLLSKERARQVVAELRSVLVPGGAIFAVFDGDGHVQPPSLRYRIVSESRLGFASTDWPRLPRPISTHEIDRFFKGMKPRQLTVMRHGSRESVGQRPVGPAASDGEPWPQKGAVLSE